MTGKRVFRTQSMEEKRGGGREGSGKNLREKLMEKEQRLRESNGSRGGETGNINE